MTSKLSESELNFLLNTSPIYYFAFILQSKESLPYKKTPPVTAKFSFFSKFSVNNLLISVNSIFPLLNSSINLNNLLIFYSSISFKG